MRFVIEQSRSGGETLICELNGKKYSIYSRYTPERDGERFFHENRIDGCDFYILLGMGLGYHVFPFLREEEVRRVVVLEPIESLSSCVENVERVRELLRHKKLKVYTGERAKHFVNEIGRRYDYLFYSKIKVLSYEPLKKLFFEEYNQLEKGIAKALASLTNDGLTIGRFAKVWINNFYRNIQGLKEIELVSSLYNGWKGTAVVTGAGPSLDENLTDIRRSRRDLFLIATDASLKPLMGRGIKPDLIITLDPQSSVFLHFSGLCRDDIKNIPVVMNLLCNPMVFKLFNTRYIYFTLHPTSSLFDAVLKGGGEMLLNFRSVSSLALRVATLMGFEDIYISGFDFSFPMMRVYARNSFFYESGMARGNRFAPYLNPEGEMLKRNHQTIDGYERQALRTSPNLLEYLREIEGAVITKKGRRVRLFNWNPKGVFIQGAETVKEFLPHRGVEQREKKRISLPLDVGRAMSREGRHDLILTLALRNRIYRKERTKQMAFESAERYIRYRCE